MAGLKPVYLLHGDDVVRLDAWRARVRARADSSEDASFEVFDARRSGPGDIAASLTALTFAGGDRFLLADGVEAWKAGALEPLEQALEAPAPDTFLVLIARPAERGSKPPSKRLITAVENADGEVREFAAPKPWKLPGWVAERARDAGLAIDADAARELVEIVGPQQRRLERELEKLALAIHPEQRIGIEAVESLAAGDSSVRAYHLADAVVAGDRAAAFSLAEELRTSGERAGGLLFPVVRRLRDVHRAAELLEAGASRSAIGKELGSPQWAVKRIVAAAEEADRDALAQALTTFAELEVELRGEGDPPQLDEQNALTRALAQTC